MLSKNKILASSILLLPLCLFSSGCSSGPKTLQEYPDSIYAPISEETQSEIEAAYRAEFGEGMRWCLPKEADRFPTKGSLRRYIAAHQGWRCYASFGETYLLFEFEGSLDWSRNFGWPELYFGHDQVILDGKEYWNNRWSGKALIYRTGEFNNVVVDEEGYMDLSKSLDITSDEASIITIRHQAYIDQYFGKFMIEGDEDPNDAFWRIRMRWSIAGVPI